MVKVKLECTVSFGKATITSGEVNIEVLEENVGNKFLSISVKDKKYWLTEARIFISTEDLKRILRAVGVTSIY